MKNLKDYFSSPKSSDVSLNESVNGRPDSPVDNVIPTQKRKSKKSLSSKNSKRKKLSEDNTIQSPVNASLNCSLSLDESVEDFDVVQPRSSKKTRITNSKPKSGKSLSLKKRKSVKNDENLVIGETEPVPLIETNQNQIPASSKRNFFSKFKDKIVVSETNSLNNEKKCSDSNFSNISETDVPNDIIINNSNSTSVPIVPCDKGNESVNTFNGKDTKVNTPLKETDTATKKKLKHKLNKKIICDVKKTSENENTANVSSIEDDLKCDLNVECVGSNNKKRNRTTSENIEQTMGSDDISSGSKKKKKKSSEISDDKNSLSENMLNNEASTPESRQSLLNYFKHVDKGAVLSKSEEKRIIKVEAIVHEPRSSERSERSRPIMKTKIKKKKQPDFDLITSEEDSSNMEETYAPVVTPKKPTWQMRINIQSPICNGDSTTEDFTLNEESLSSREEKQSNGGEVILLDEESNSVMEISAKKIQYSSTPNIKEDVVTVDDESSDVIETIDISQTSDNTHSLKGAKTLSAYFGLKSDSKKDKRPEERSLATQLFLQSSTPSSLKKIVQQKVREEKEGTAAPYPVHSHVRQRDKLSIIWNLPSKKLKFKSSHQDRIPSVPEFTRLCCLEDETSVSKAKPTSTTAEVKAAIKRLIEESNLPIKKLIKDFKGMKKSSAVGVLWVEKYCPKITEDALIGRKNICLISDWLEKFQSNIANGSDSESSGDEFINDKDEKSNKYGNTALLVGPPGVGKTAAVFAAAKQNGYQVLELNASCNRTGKKVYHEFSEATQSHKVETKSLFKSKSKKKDKSKQSNKKSLLLMEDSDIIFSDLDDGFINCLSLLQSSSKRPLILVANDANCKHLMKLVSSNSAIYLSFERPPSHILSPYLESICLAEGQVLSQEACKLLVESTQCDLRKSINNLQFYGPLFAQLDRRKLCLLNENLSAFTDSYDDTKDEAIATVKRGNALCLVDIVSSKKDYGRFSWFRESTVVEPKSNDGLVDLLRSDILDALTSSLATKHQPFVSYSDALSAGDSLSEVVDSTECLSRRAIACDYMSSLRHMARTERIRLSGQTKRNKRYYNHLNNLGFDTSDQRLIDALCSTFGDGSDEQNSTYPNFEDLTFND